MYMKLTKIPQACNCLYLISILLLMSRVLKSRISWHVCITISQHSLLQSNDPYSLFSSPGLSVPTLTALSKLLGNQDDGEAVTTLVREVNGQFNQDAGVTVPISVRLWRAPGCHEFLASLGKA